MHVCFFVKCKNSLYLLVIIFTWFTSLSVTADGFVPAKTTAEQVLTVNVGLTVFPPLIQEDGEGGCFGSVVDKINSTFPSSQYDVNLYCSTPTRVYRDLANSMIDLTVNVKSTKSMTDNVYFSDRPAATLQVFMVSYPNSKIESVLAIREFSYGNMRDTLLEQGVNIVEQSNSKEAVTVFLRRGTDAIITYRLPFDFYYDQITQSTNLIKEDLTFEQIGIGEVGAFFVVNRNSANARQLIEIINAAN